MADNDTRKPVESSDTDESTTSRRTMLKAAGTTIVGGAGLAATSGSASAQIWSDVDVIEIDESWGSWSGDDDLPVTDGLFVFIHGWFGDTTVSSQAEDVLDSLEDGGYEPDEAVALEWPATNFIYTAAEGDTEDVGGVAADLVEDFYDDGGENVRLVGHSLGGRCVLWAATELGPGYEIETVAPLGAAADGSEICDGIWSAATDGADEIRNYHSENDTTVGFAYGGLFDTALGNEGATCDPDGYTDVDVTDSVSSHLGFLGDSSVGDDLAEAITGESGGSDDDPWWA